MGIYSDALNQTLQSPMTGMAIGLLGGAAPGGTMAGGMQQGLLNSQGMASNQAQIAEREHRMGLLSQEEARRAQALERLNTWADSNPVGTPASTSNFEQDLFPGEQPTQGLLNETPATGMYALNPQKAAMQQGLIQANRAGSVTDGADRIRPTAADV